MSKRAYLGILGAIALGLAGLVIASGALASASPTVSTVTATGVSNSAATLTATVNPNGQATTYAFEYGTSTHYSQQTAVQSAGAGTKPVNATTQVTDLRPGTTYHVRTLASSSAGTTAGNDATFKTTGIAQPGSGSAQVTSGAATAIAVDGAKLTGTINPVGVPTGETVHYYFQLGSSQPYALQTTAQSFTATGAAVSVSAETSGLESMQLFHYRLVAVSDGGQEVNVGADETFTTLPKERLQPSAVQINASPRFERSLPDRVTVSGRMVPPSSLSDLLACRGYFDITFRVGQIAVQSLRAGIHKDCTFSLPVVFHNRKRLMGGRVTVHVLFAGNRFLHRLEAPPVTIQVG
jgi:hypothetical protein